MTTKRFNDAFSAVNDKYIDEAVNYNASKKNVWLRLSSALAACLVIAILVGVKMNHGEDFISLNINEISNASYSAPKITSTVESILATEADIENWLDNDINNILPNEMKEYTMKYWIVKNVEVDEIIGVKIEGKVEDSDTPKPKFYIKITEGHVLQDLLFDYDITTDIDGVSIIAGMIPGEMKTNRDGEEKYIPAKYYSLFDAGIYHCAVETQGAVSEEAFSELNNILVDILLKKIRWS